MARKVKMVVVSFKAEPELKALFPEMSRLHNRRSIGDVIRRLLWSEAQRLSLTAPGDHSHRRGHKRFTT